MCPLTHIVIFWLVSSVPATASFIGSVLWIMMVMVVMTERKRLRRKEKRKILLGKYLLSALFQGRIILKQQCHQRKVAC